MARAARTRNQRDYLLYAAFAATGEGGFPVPA